MPLDLIGENADFYSIMQSEQQPVCTDVLLSYEILSLLREHILKLFCFFLKYIFILWLT